MVQHETLSRMEDSTKGMKHRQTNNLSFTECVTRMQKLQAGSSLPTDTSPVDGSLQSWGGRVRENPKEKMVVASVGRLQEETGVGRCCERLVGDGNKDQWARSKLRRSSLSKNDDRLQLTADAGLQGSEHSPASSPNQSRPVHFLPRRPRAATFSYPSSYNYDSLSPFTMASPTSLSEVTKNGARKGKGIVALCNMMQKQGGGFDHSPVLARVRHYHTTNKTGLPTVVGVSPVVHRKKQTTSPYNTSLAKRQLDFSSSRGIDLWVSPQLQRHSDPLPLPALQAASKSSSSTKQHQRKASLKEALGAKNTTSPKRPSSAKNRKDKALLHGYTGHKRSDSDSSVGGHTQQTCVQVSLAPPLHTNGQPHTCQHVSTTAGSGLGIPAITVRAATPCPFDSQHTRTEEGDKREPSLTEQFAIRAELAEVLRQLSLDVQDIVHATNCLDKEGLN